MKGHTASQIIAGEAGHIMVMAWHLLVLCTKE